VSGLEVLGLSKSFDGLRVVENVWLTVASDELCGLIGPNGAGKSTLFALITGFEEADHGEVRFFGERLDGLPPERRARRGLARTFQVPRPFSHLSVRQNLAVAAPAQSGEHLFAVFARPGKVRREEAAIAERVEEVLAFLELHPVAEMPGRQLSGGQRKLLEIGRVLMTEPKFLLLDEPFAGVNPRLIEVIADKIRTLNAGGIGCLVVEHNIQALARLAHRLFVMDWGRVLAEGAPDEVLARPEVREAYIGGG
jgi:branched-chain amino acid transport system ATP-binding protein